jgi:hypothetical protein
MINSRKSRTQPSTTFARVVNAPPRTDADIVTMSVRVTAARSRFPIERVDTRRRVAGE